VRRMLRAAVWRWIRAMLAWRERYVCRIFGYSGVNDNLFDVLVGLVFCQLNDGREKSLK
jgi:hypothetical protein